MDDALWQVIEGCWPKNPRGRLRAVEVAEMMDRIAGASPVVTRKRLGVLDGPDYRVVKIRSWKDDETSGNDPSIENLDCAPLHDRGPCCNVTCASCTDASRRLQRLYPTGQTFPSSRLDIWSPSLFADTPQSITVQTWERSSPIW
ncbi:hypothetical protein JAAARDRAFT_529624 [Jaapia argillacea MUCL 33604]|uniref:Uncharacterized protein n=1 Tax=Jaapia argillacea MUCL 33604 TaxID=933084 RepID=A0A067PK81_9AGAM|nr:hypothetical protein JAAARDRAFT_529624 [Jaapia argillacea MUCL 33604]